MYLSKDGTHAYDSRFDVGNGYVVMTIMGIQAGSVVLGVRKGERGSPFVLRSQDLMKQELLKTDLLVDRVLFRTNAICHPAYNRRALQ
jgi:hypothetical protein